MNTETKILKDIGTLPVFADLGTKELDGLLSLAQVRNYKKGKTLFRQGEEVINLYFVIDGWVKVYKGSDSGDEAILQICSDGDILMAPSVFLDIPALASGQLVQDSKVLSLPAAAIRKEVSLNGKLAVNIIHSLSVYSQELIQKIEHSRLMTAAERVGWFLLKLSIQQSQGTQAIIKLPFDKSTIAAYLDMTPETFSRTLKQFKAKGFQIKSGTIVKPMPNALCGFCDEGLALECAAVNCTMKVGCKTC